jgi:hypothetical protein
MEADMSVLVLALGLKIAAVMLFASWPPRRPESLFLPRTPRSGNPAAGWREG